MRVGRMKFLVLLTIVLGLLPLMFGITLSVIDETTEETGYADYAESPASAPAPEAVLPESVIDHDTSYFQLETQEIPEEIKKQLERRAEAEPPPPIIEEPVLSDSDVLDTFNEESFSVIKLITSIELKEWLTIIGTLNSIVLTIFTLYEKLKTKHNENRSDFQSMRISSRLRLLLLSIVNKYCSAILSIRRNIYWSIYRAEFAIIQHKNMPGNIVAIKRKGISWPEIKDLLEDEAVIDITSFDVKSKRLTGVIDVVLGEWHITPLHETIHEAVQDADETENVICLLTEHENKVTLYTLTSRTKHIPRSMQDWEYLIESFRHKYINSATDIKLNAVFLIGTAG